MRRQIHHVVRLTASALGICLVAFLFLLFGSALLHVLSAHLRLEDGYRWAGLGEMHGPGGTVMWICGGEPAVDWRTLPLYALVYFAISWQIAWLPSIRSPQAASRLAPWACLLGLCLLEYPRLSSLTSLLGEPELGPELADYLKLECAYLLCALAATFLGAWLGREATRRHRLSTVVGWVGGVAFLMPVPYLSAQRIVSPVPETILLLLMTYVLTACLFVYAFVHRRSIRRLAWLWLISVFATLAVTDLG